jgi:hypothetical protein
VTRDIIIILLIIIIIIAVTISKPFKEYRINVPRKHDIKELQKTVIMGTAHILQQVLT